MKQRYIDFVPAKGKKGSKKPVGGSSDGMVPVRKESGAKTRVKPSVRIGVKPGVKSGVKPAIKPVMKKKASEFWIDEDWADDGLAIEEMFAEKPDSSMDKLGVIEDFQPKFVQGADVKKRPLGRKLAKSVAKPAMKSGVKAGVKATTRSAAGAGVKTVARPAAGAGVKAATRPAMGAVAKPLAEPGARYKGGPRGPRAAFVNVNKIEKRPLSRSGYASVRKPIPYKREEPKGPEKIITKPEKDSNAGLIITIVVTIILGAAAGTVAFLLLPK